MIPLKKTQFGLSVVLLLTSITSFAMKHPETEVIPQLITEIKEILKETSQTNPESSVRFMIKSNQCDLKTVLAEIKPIAKNHEESLTVRSLDPSFLRLLITEDGDNLLTLAEKDEGSEGVVNFLTKHCGFDPNAVLYNSSGERCDAKTYDKPDKFSKKKVTVYTIGQHEYTTFKTLTRYAETIQDIISELHHENRIQF